MQGKPEIIIRLPYPPSNNSAYRNVNGIMKKSRVFRDYSKDAAKRVAVHPRLKDIREISAERIKLDITAYPPDKRKRDLDNLGKVLLDSLQAAGVFLDDSQIDDLRFRRGPVSKPGRVAIIVSIAE